VLDLIVFRILKIHVFSTYGRYMLMKLLFMLIIKRVHMQLLCNLQKKHLQDHQSSTKDFKQ